MQVALARVEPWGDERADLRAGRNAAFQIASASSTSLSDGQFEDLVQTLVRYLKCQQPPEQTVNVATLRKALGDEPCPTT